MTATELTLRELSDFGSGSSAHSLKDLLDAILPGVPWRFGLDGSHTASMLWELAHAVEALRRGKRERASVQIFNGDELWELGLETDGDGVLATLFRPGPNPEIAVYEQALAFPLLHQLVVKAWAETPALRGRARPSAVLSSEPLAEPGRPRLERLTTNIHAKSALLNFAGQAAFRRGKSQETNRVSAELERADLHALLARGRFLTIERQRTLALDNVCLFLLAERFLALSVEVLDAWRCERALFRRTVVDGVQISVRRGPGDGPLALSIHGRSTDANREATTLTGIDPRRFVEASARFARDLANTFIEHDAAQSRNLRLKGVLRSARGLLDAVNDAKNDDSLTNPEPETYRAFGLPREERVQGPWAHGAKMRFAPRWMAQVPSIDLRTILLGGDRLIVGAERETACLDRNTGHVLWKLNLPRAATVMTPLGLVRIATDGALSLHELENGEMQFSTQLAPRARGGAAGALVNAPGLPKVLAVVEGDRAISAVDLVTGEVRWRYSARRSTHYRLRRAGKLMLVSGGDSALVALDVVSGEVVWRVRDRLPFSGDVSVDKDSAFALSGGNSGSAKLHHIDLWSGVVRFTRELEERPLPGQPPLLAGDTVAVVTRDRRGVGLSGFSREDGAKKYAHAPGLVSEPCSWITLDDSFVVNSASGTLVSLNALSGEIRYSHVFSRAFETDEPRQLEPVMRGGALFVPQFQVHVVRPRDGELLGTVPTDLIPDVLRVDEACSVYIGEQSGHLAAFSAAPRLTLVRE